MRYISHRWGGLQVGYGPVGNDERCRVRRRDARSKGHVCGNPMHKLDSGAIARDVEIHNEEDARWWSWVVVVVRWCPPYCCTDVGRVHGFCVTNQKMPTRRHEVNIPGRGINSPAGETVLLPKLTTRLWLAGTGKPGPVCAVATPSAAAAVKIVLPNMLYNASIG